jgi:hypothetical protein
LDSLVCMMYPLVVILPPNLHHSFGVPPLISAWFSLLSFLLGVDVTGSSVRSMIVGSVDREVEVK